MRSPAAATLWEFRRRHRWGLIGLGVYLVALAAIKLATLRGVLSIKVDNEESFAFVVLVPLTAAVVYFLAVFSFGLSGDLAGRPSMYPARMFTLPVTTSALAFWPMLYGTAAMVMLWLATRLLALWPSGVAVPIIWPALMAAALLGWTQALTWMPYGLPGLRAIVALLWLFTIDSVVLLALNYQASESLMVLLLAPLTPLAYVAARFAVARARRGDVPDWRRELGTGDWGLGHRIPYSLFPSPLVEARFPSPARAQAWFEWRRHGRSLPVWVAILLPFELALLFVAGNAAALVFLILLGALLTPTFMAAVSAATVRESDPHARDAWGLAPFLATRPQRTAELVAARLKNAARSTLASWLLVLIAVPLGLAWSGTWSVMAGRVSRLAAIIGTPRTVILVLLLLAGFFASTWKQLVQNLCIGLTGRAWLVKASVFVTLTLLFLLGPIVQWIADHQAARAALWNGIPLILAVLACLKMTAATVLAMRHYRSRVLSDRTLLTGAACWCGAVLALYALFVWFLPRSSFFPRHVLALMAILAVPLARPAATPLALAWNRHR